MLELYEIVQKELLLPHLYINKKEYDTTTTNNDNNKDNFLVSSLLSTDIYIQEFNLFINRNINKNIILNQNTIFIKNRNEELCCDKSQMVDKEEIIKIEIEEIKK